MTDPQASPPQRGGPERAGAAGVTHDQPPSVPPPASPAPYTASRPSASESSAYARPEPGEPGRGEARILSAIAGMAWPSALAAGIGMLAVGVLLLAWPSATLTVVAILIGAALVVAGVFRLFDGIMTRGESGGMRAADIVIGLLAIVVGLYALKHHALTVVVLALVVGVIWVIHGISDLVIAASAGDVPGRGLRVVTGLLSLAAGLVILIWPSISLVLLLTILGAWLLLYGIMLIVLALRLRHDSKKTTSRVTRPATAS
jgi:uncharacterized membrane protein HdeD (DUF308 family)